MVTEQAADSNGAGTATSIGHDAVMVTAQEHERAYELRRASQLLDADTLAKTIAAVGNESATTSTRSSLESSRTSIDGDEQALWRNNAGLARSHAKRLSRVGAISYRGGSRPTSPQEANAPQINGGMMSDEGIAALTTGKMVRSVSSSSSSNANTSILASVANSTIQNGGPTSSDAARRIAGIIDQRGRSFHDLRAQFESSPSRPATSVAQKRSVSNNAAILSPSLATCPTIRETMRYMGLQTASKSLSSLPLAEPSPPPSPSLATHTSDAVDAASTDAHIELESTIEDSAAAQRTSIAIDTAQSSESDVQHQPVSSPHPTTDNETLSTALAELEDAMTIDEVDDQPWASASTADPKYATSLSSPSLLTECPPEPRPEPHPTQIERSVPMDAGSKLPSAVASPELPISALQPSGLAITMEDDLNSGTLLDGLEELSRTIQELSAETQSRRHDTARGAREPQYTNTRPDSRKSSLRDDGPAHSATTPVAHSPRTPTAQSTSRTASPSLSARAGLSPTQAFSPNSPTLTLRSRGSASSLFDPTKTADSSPDLTTLAASMHRTTISSPDLGAADGKSTLHLLRKHAAALAHARDYREQTTTNGAHTDTPALDRMLSNDSSDCRSYSREHDSSSSRTAVSPPVIPRTLQSNVSPSPIPLAARRQSGTRQTRRKRQFSAVRLSTDGSQLPWSEDEGALSSSMASCNASDVEEALSNPVQGSPSHSSGEQKNRQPYRHPSIATIFGPEMLNGREESGHASSLSSESNPYKTPLRNGWTEHLHATAGAAKGLSPANERRRSTLARAASTVETSSGYRVSQSIRTHRAHQRTRSEDQIKPLLNTADGKSDPALSRIPEQQNANVHAAAAASTPAVRSTRVPPLPIPSAARKRTVTVPSPSLRPVDAATSAATVHAHAYRQAAPLAHTAAAAAASISKQPIHQATATAATTSYPVVEKLALGSLQLASHATNSATDTSVPTTSNPAAAFLPPPPPQQPPPFSLAPPHEFRRRRCNTPDVHPRAVSTVELSSWPEIPPSARYATVSSRSPIHTGFQENVRNEMVAAKHASRLSTLSRARSMEFGDKKRESGLGMVGANGAAGAATVQRRLVIMELVNTEALYAADLEVLSDVYYRPAKASPLFGPANVRALFSNLESISQFSRDFVSALVTASGMTKKNEDDKSYCYAVKLADKRVSDGGSVGARFLEQLEAMESVYTDYCKRFDTAMERLTELKTQPQFQRFFAECAKQLVGRTSSWDLGSLLIKPVQRVLKYPLLVQEILKHTSPDHTDHRQLLQLSGALQHMADRINEVKRRKEVVEGIVGGKKRHVDLRLGLQKRINRNTRKLLLRSGRQDETVDEHFNELHSLFIAQQQLIGQFTDQADSWLLRLKEYFQQQQSQAAALEQVYLIVRDPLWSVSLGNHVIAYRLRMSLLIEGIWQDTQRDMQTMVHEPLERLAELYRGPQAVIQKRAKKLPDYDRAQSIRQRNEKPDRLTQEAADTYAAINTQLIEELPIFLRNTGRLFNIVAGDLVRLQSETYKRINNETRDVYNILAKNGFCRGELDKVTIEYDRAMNGEFSFTTLLMDLGVVNGSWRELELDMVTTSIGNQSIISGAASVYSEHELGRRTQGRHSEEASVYSVPTANGSPNVTPKIQPAPLRRRMKELRRSVSHGSLTAAASRQADMLSSENVAVGLHDTLPNATQQHLTDYTAAKSSAALAKSSSATSTTPHSTMTTTIVTTNASGTSSATSRYLFLAVTLYRYQPEEDAKGVLELRMPGISVGVIASNDSGDWLYGRDLENGTAGWFPASYCQRLS